MRGPGKDRVAQTCGHCNKPGHTKAGCFGLHPDLLEEFRRKRALRSGRREAKLEKRKENTSSLQLDEDHTAAVAFLNTALLSFQPQFGLAASEPSGLLERIHVLDSGASSHTFCRRQNFTSLEKFTGSAINGIAGSAIMPAGQGTYTLRTIRNNAKGTTIFHKALYVPDAHCNLVSVSALEEDGATILFRKGRAVITSHGKVILSATRKFGLYVIDEDDQQLHTAMAAYSVSDPKLQIWHDRLGHLGEQNLHLLMKMSTGITPLSDSNVCEACVKGRMKERPHRGCIRKGTRPLESLHGDIAGPFPDEGIDGHRYWACFIDDFTKMTWVFPIRQKSEFGNCLRQLLEQAETPTRRCRYLRLDRGGENQADAITLYCENKMIEMIFSATEQHEQNGVAEVANRVLLEKLTATLIHSGLEKKFWPYVLKAMAYVRNLSPASGRQITPYEAWHKEVPDLSHLRVIGSRGFAKMPSAKRKKMDDKTVPCRLLGYQGSTNYVLVDDDGRIFFANNVVFDEKSLLRKRIASEQPTDEPNAKRMDLTPSLPTIPLTENIRTDEEIQSAPSQSYQLNQDEPSFHVELGTPERTQSPDGAVDEHQVVAEAADGHPQQRFPVRETRGQIPSRYTVLAQQDPSAQQNQWRFTMIAIHLAMIANNLEPTEPKTFAEAMNSPHSEQWMQAMIDEIDSLMRNGTFIPVSLPPGKHTLQGKWVYKLKRGKDGEITRFKARFVVRGFEQKEGIDYHETFASVVKPMSYKMIFAIAAALDLELEQMDVKTAFLYGGVKEEIYVTQPQGFDDKSGRVFRLRKALYGLKQSPRIWYQTLSDFLEILGFKPLNADVGVFIRGTTYIAVYVDDLLIAGPDKEEIRQIKAALSEKFEMTDLGPCQYYLGMSVRRDRRNKAIFLSQRAYVEKVLREFDMWESKPVTTPLSTSKFQPVPDEYRAPKTTKLWYAKAIGSLMYAMLGTRPDIAFAVSLCSRYLGNPTNEHVQAVKRIMRYLRGTIDLELTFSGPLRPLVGYTDSDWAGDHDTRRSTAGYVFNVGTGAISWNSKRQPTVALSSCEAEYMGQTQCTKEAIWLRGLLRELLAQYKHGDLQTTILYGDNQGAIAMAKNPQFHARTKHIDLQWHYVRERVSDGDVELQYVPTEQQIADGLTKALPKDRFIVFRNALGLSNP